MEHFFTATTKYVFHQMGNIFYNITGTTLEYGIGKLNKLYKLFKQAINMQYNFYLIHKALFKLFHPDFKFISLKKINLFSNINTLKKLFPI